MFNSVGDDPITGQYPTDVTLGTVSVIRELNPVQLGIHCIPSDALQTSPQFANHAKNQAKSIFSADIMCVQVISERFSSMFPGPQHCL